MNAASYGAALKLLEDIAGIDALKIVDAGKSTRAGDVWTLRTRAGVEVAECNVRHHTCACHFIPGDKGKVCIAIMQTVRVLCGACRHPKILAWPVTGGDAFVCSHCQARVFLPAR